MAKILVTGGAGFIGSHLVDYLIGKKHKVVVIDDLSLGKKENLNPKAKLYKLDIRSKKVKEVFKKEKFEFVFHLAAQINVRESVLDPLFDAQVNVLGSLNLLENSCRCRIKKFIFISSGGAMYGDTKEIPTPESHPASPVSPYGVSKFSVEKYLHYYQNEFGLDYTVFRYANVYGPRQNPDGEAGVVSIFLSYMLLNKQPIINGDGKQTRDYVYVKDVVAATAMALKKDGKVFNVGTGKETNVVELFKKMVKLGKFKVKEKHGQTVRGEQRRSCLNCSCINKKWGFQTKYDLTKGILETITWFKENEV